MEGGTNVSAEYLSKRLHSREEESDDSFLKRLRTIEHVVPSHSKLVVRLGPRAEKYTFRVAVCRLLTQSMKLTDIIGSKLEEDGNFKGSAVAQNGKYSDFVIDLLDFQCDGEILRIVEDFCDSDDPSMEEGIISASNVVRLFHAGKFLQIESLIFAAQAYLDKHVFNSWENCLDVLATFNCTDVSSGDTNLDSTRASSVEADTAGEDTLFDICLKVFLRKIEVKHRVNEDITIGCNADCLIEVAQHLQPNVAELVYQSCRASKYGLFLRHTQGSPNWMPVVNHLQVDSAFEPPLQGFVVLEDGQDILKWIERLSDLVEDKLRRAPLVVHLSRIIRMIVFPGMFWTYISLDFVCGLLVQASQLIEATWTKGSESGLSKEIVFLSKLVGQALGLRSYDQKTVPFFTRFTFGTLLSIVKHFKYGASAQNIVPVAKIIDGCIQEHIKDRSFTREQALMVYKEFAKNLRPSHLDTFLHRCLDYEKLPDDIVEQLFTLGCDSRLAKRFVEIQVLKQKNHSDEVLNKLRIDLDLRTKELQRVKAKLCSELCLRTVDLVQLRMEKELEEERLKDELKRAIEIQNANNEELVQVRSERDAFAEAKRSLEKKELELIQSKQHVQIQLHKADQAKNVAELETIEVRKQTELEREIFTKAKKLAESERDVANHTLEEEKQKSICQICFENPRDTMCLPCTHFQYCSKCLRLHYQQQRTCPTCRGFTSGVMKCNLAL